MALPHGQLHPVSSSSLVLSPDQPASALDRILASNSWTPHQPPPIQGLLLVEILPLRPGPDPSSRCFLVIPHRDCLSVFELHNVVSLSAFPEVGLVLLYAVVDLLRTFHV